jgi:ribosomal protein L37AE/L43A
VKIRIRKFTATSLSNARRMDVITLCEHDNLKRIGEVWYCFACEEEFGFDDD